MNLISKTLAIFVLTTTLLCSCDIYKFELDNIVRAEQEKCPLKINDGMMQTQVSLTDTCVLFVIEYDETLYTPDYVESKANSIKEAMLSNINVDNADMRNYINELADNAKHCQLPLIWTYEGSASHKKTIVKIEPSEIKN